MLGNDTTSCVPCGVHQPQRNNYFDGKFLLSRDFVDEQDYFRGHRHLHNAHLHGAGTACGLKLVEHPSSTCQRDFVVCEPGMALDCFGQEVIVPDRALVRVREMIDADEELQAELDGENHLFVAVERCDAGVEPVPAILPTCEGEGGAEFGRIAEGYRFRLFARSPQEAASPDVPVRPEVEWVHSFSFDGAVPRAVHVNTGEGLVQIAMGDPTANNTYVYDLDTHDLRAVLAGPAVASDTASVGEARLVLVAGSGFPTGDGGSVDGVGVWRATTMRTQPQPLGVIPTSGPRPRLAVSPVSGTVYVLDVDGADSRLVSYTIASLTDWLPDPGAPEGTPPAGPTPAEGGDLSFGHGFGAESDAAGRGSAMLEISRDGRFLVVISPVGNPSERLYLIDAARFAAGGLDPADARPGSFSRPGSERLEAVRWSYDDDYLYLLSRRPAAGGTLLLHRFALVEDAGGGADLVREGSGVTLEARGFDLALAPTETRAYVLLAEAETGDAGGATRLTTVDLDEVKAVTLGDEPTPVPVPAEAIRFEGTGRFLTPTDIGNRLYVAVADDGEAPPDRGLVAVVDIEEQDCTLAFDALIDGCAGCAGDDHSVVLGHIPGYVHDPERDGPRIRDRESAEEGDVAIDNLTYRPIVPSASVLKEVVECIAAQGVAEGPPGPRGDDGRDGVNGVDGAPGVDGEPGEDGLGIDAATLTYEDIDEPAVSIIEGDPRILDIRLPEPERTEAQAGIPIIGLSWLHDEVNPRAGGRSDLISLLAERGLAMAFAERVPWGSFRRDGGIGPSMVAELQIPLLHDNFLHWVGIPGLQVAPIVDIDPPEGLIEEWRIVDGAPDEAFNGFALLGDAQLDAEIDLSLGFRVVLYADFVVDERGLAVDGTFLGGTLPTGSSAPGGTFRSWFFLEG